MRYDSKLVQGQQQKKFGLIKNQSGSNSWSKWCEYCLEANAYLYEQAANKSPVHCL